MTFCPCMLARFVVSISSCFLSWLLSCSLDQIPNRQFLIFSECGSTLAGHSAVPRGTKVARMSGNRAIRTAAQRTQGL